MKLNLDSLINFALIAFVACLLTVMLGMTPFYPYLTPHIPVILVICCVLLVVAFAGYLFYF
jgi:hypothetical protein